jgi:hypothetical protein
MPDISDSDPHRKMWKHKSPIALFVSVRKNFYSEPRLMPIAIQMDSEPGEKTIRYEGDGRTTDLQL